MNNNFACPNKEDNSFYTNGYNPNAFKSMDLIFIT